VYKILVDKAERKRTLERYWSRRENIKVEERIILNCILKI
jgi:hypothetical protein